MILHLFSMCSATPLLLGTPCSSFAFNPAPTSALTTPYAVTVTPTPFSSCNETIISISIASFDKATTTTPPHPLWSQWTHQPASQLTLPCQGWGAPSTTPLLVKAVTHHDPLGSGLVQAVPPSCSALHVSYCSALVFTYYATSTTCLLFHYRYSCGHWSFTSVRPFTGCLHQGKSTPDLPSSPPRHPLSGIPPLTVRGKYIPSRCWGGLAPGLDQSRHSLGPHTLTLKSAATTFCWAELLKRVARGFNTLVSYMFDALMERS